MEVQHYVNNVGWPRGEDVAIRDGYLQCKLAFDWAYDLAAAYEEAPHVAFMQLEDDDDLARFVSQWGPLRLSDQEKAQGLARMSLDWCWGFQRRFTAFGRLLECFGRTDTERRRLREFLAASEEESRLRGLGAAANPTVFLCAWLQEDKLAAQIATNASTGADGLSQVIGLWLKQADSASIRGAVAYLIHHVSFTPPASLKAEWKGSRSQITATLGLESLEDALEWMIWNSYWMKNPLSFCMECGRAFRRESKHRRK